MSEVTRVYLVMEICSEVILDDDDRRQLQNFDKIVAACLTLEAAQSHIDAKTTQWTEHRIVEMPISDLIAKRVLYKVTIYGKEKPKLVEETTYEDITKYEHCAFSTVNEELARNFLNAASQLYEKYVAPAIEVYIAPRRESRKFLHEEMLRYGLDTNPDYKAGVEQYLQEVNELVASMTVSK